MQPAQRGATGAVSPDLTRANRRHPKAPAAPTLLAPRIGLVLTVLVLVVNAALSYRTTTWLDEARIAARKSSQAVTTLEDVLRCMVDAESSLRGFVITGIDTALVPLQEANEALGPKLDALALLYKSQPAKVESISRIRLLVTAKLRELSDAAAIRRSGGYQPAANTSANRIDSLAELRRALGALHAEEVRLLDSYRFDETSRLAFLQQSLVIVTIGDILLVVLFYLLVFKNLNERRRHAEALHAANEQMADSYRHLEKRNFQIETLSEMIAALQSCPTSDEAFLIIATFCGKLLGDCSGALYAKRPASELMERTGHWGKPDLRADSFDPQACWALRRGTIYRVDAPDQDLICAHRQTESAGATRAYLCVPLSGQGEVLGLIYLESGDPGAAVSRETEQMVHTLADQASLALSNLRLRETLHQHAIIDPLTGLYNRRYFDEAMRREFARAARRGASIAFIVADADHFKKFNDSYGHDAGDAVLRSLAAELRNHIRASDIACRYGGEEFVIVLAEANKDIALRRAEAIRSGMQGREVQFGAQSIGPVTVSLGVAVYPEHGENAETLFQAADQAMYRAKRAGRNRVVLAESLSPEQEALPPGSSSAG